MASEYSVWLVCDRDGENLLKDRHPSFLSSENVATVATSHLRREGVQHLPSRVKFPDAVDGFLHKYLLIFQGQDDLGRKYTEAGFQQVM